MPTQIPPPAGVVVPLSDRMLPRMVPMVPVVYPENAVKDAQIAWLMTEFAAANAIIDNLCSHITQLEGGAVGVGTEYESAFSAIHQRRREWIPILNMQRYSSIADVTLELRKVAYRKSLRKNISLQTEEANEVQEETNGLAVSSYSEKETTPELCVSEKEIISENSDKEIISENSDKEIISENSEKEIISGNSEKEMILKNSEEITPELQVSEKEIISEKSDKEIVSENSEKEIISENSENGNDCDGEVVDEDTAKDDSPESEVTDTGSKQLQPYSPQDNEICSNHAACEARRNQIKIRKGFTAKVLVKGHMMNVLKGLKVYEDVFTDNELSKLNEFVNELRVAGRNGELTGVTFSLYNQQIKGRKREQIQFGVPVFEQIKEDSASKSQRSNIEPIPSLLEYIIDHLVQWHIISESRRPNSCIINFYDEDEYSQPYQKPPHLDQPISTLLLSESRMAFGQSLVDDNEGNYTGLVLSLKEGSILVMKGNSAEVGRHVMCSSPNKRVSIQFIRNRTHTERSLESVPSPTTAMNSWHPGNQNPHSKPAGTVNGCQPMGVIQKWGAFRAPMVMLTPLRPVVMSTRRMPRCGNGTGVFLPWNAKPRRPAKHLPPRAQKSRLLAMSSPAETCKSESTSDPIVQ